MCIRDRDAPVQSLYGFAACPYRMTVGGLLALAAGLKYLWLLCCTALIFLLCARAANAAAAVGGAAVCGGIAALMAGSTQLWLRNLSLWQLADGQADVYKRQLPPGACRRSPAGGNDPGI